MNPQHNFSLFILHFSLSFCLWACGGEDIVAKKLAEIDLNEALPIDTVALLPADQREKIVLSEDFLALPARFLAHSIADAPADSERVNIVNQLSGFYTDIIYTPRALSYVVQQGDKGAVTNVVLYQDSAGHDVLGIEHSIWENHKLATEALYFLEKWEEKGWVNMNKEQLLPKIRLADFYENPPQEVLVQADHNLQPMLCYELALTGDMIRVFLGEYKPEDFPDQFVYEGEKDFIVLEWQDNVFRKKDGSF